MELRHLSAIVSVVDKGSFSAAARASNLSQPALWAQVKAFEQETGVALFARTGRRVEATPACRALLPRMRATLDTARGVLEGATFVRSGHAVPARIGCAPHWVRTFLAPLLGRLRARDPGYPLPQIVSVSSTSATETLLRGDVDLVVQPRIRHLPGEGVRLYDLWGAVLGAPPRTRRVDVRELDGRAIATGLRETGLRTILDDACRAARVRPRIVFESADLSSVIVLADPKSCYAIVPSDALDEVTRKRAARLCAGRRELRSENWMHWRSDDALSPAAAQLRDAILHACHGHGRGITRASSAAISS